MVARLVGPLVALGAAMVLPGCYTGIAISDLVSANPITRFQVELPDGSDDSQEINWNATYVDPLPGPDPPPMPFAFHHERSEAGSMAMPGTLAPCDFLALIAPDRRLDSLRSKGTTDLFHQPYGGVKIQAIMPDADAIPPSSSERCSLFLSFQGDEDQAVEPPAARRTFSGVIQAVDEQGTLIAQETVPREKPWLAPARWGWVLVSPILDAVAIPVTPIILIAFFVYASF